MESTHRKTWAVLNLLGFILTIVLNGMANGVPINGRTTGELSDLYPNLFTPAGFTFSIWGLIYLALLGFVVYQLIMAWNRVPAKSDFIERIGPFFLISCIANASWILAWHYEIVWLSLLIMIAIFGSLFKIYDRLQIGYNTEFPGERWCVQAPFSLYLGWITIATIANVTVLLTDMRWDGFGIAPEYWTILVLWVGVTIGYRVLRTRKDVIFSLVIMWAYFGIAMKRISEGAALTSSVSLGALIGIFLLLILAVHSLLTRNNVTA